MMETIKSDAQMSGMKPRSAVRSLSVLAVLRCAWPSLLLATSCLLPFLSKPFRIDDSHFLMMAGQIVRHPMHPMDFTVCWNTVENCTKAYALTPGNALMGYALLPTVLMGGHEWMAHLTQLLFVWVAALAMVSFVLRLGWSTLHATAAALLLVAIPPFLPMACTAMPDVLAAALAIVAMERLATWKAEQRWGQAVAAAIALGLAGFSRSHLVLLLPLGAFFLLDGLDGRKVLDQIRRKWWLWTPVIAGFGVLAAAILTVREHNLAIDPPSASLIRSHVRDNFCAYLLYFSFPLPLGVCWLANRVKARRFRMISVVAALGIVYWLLPWKISFALLRLRPSHLEFLFAVLGLGVLADLLFEALKKLDHTGLVLMLWILIPLPIIYYSHLPMKYLLPCVPAVILLCFRLLDGVSEGFSRAAIVVLIIAGCGYSLLIEHADAEFAQFGRDALHDLITPHVAAGERVWYPGQYWSFWYAPLDGAELIEPTGPQPKRGDLLVVDVYGQGDISALKNYPRRTLVETVAHKYRFGRTMGAGIGLYSNGSGYWLWGFGESDKDRFELWKID